MAHAAVLSLLSLLGAPAPAGSQSVGGSEGTLLEADLVVTAEPDGARVDLAYRVRPAPGARTIPVEVLPLPGSGLQGLTVRVWEDPVPVEIRPGPSGMLRGEVPLPVASGPGDVVRLTLRYRLPDGGGRDGSAELRGAGESQEPPRSRRSRRSRRITVPVVAVPWPPAEALPGVFTVRAALAEGDRLVDGFPALWVPEGSDSGAGPPGGQGYRAELPVLTSLVAFTVRRERGGPDLPGVLTAAVLLLLAGFLVVGGVALGRSR